MANTSEWDSVLLTDGEGAVYRVPLTDLARYQLPPAEAEELLQGDVQGFGATPMTRGFTLIGLSSNLGLAAPPEHGGDTGSPAGSRMWDLKINKKV